mmetsp:Transcript_15959/g.48271  ORF Transcript_15959/g.48271 Transcript_15959/m.48271 type:complete len:187 (-) Transcript_15959:13-573(-)
MSPQALKRLLEIVPVSEVPGDYDKRTALHLAAAEGQRECAEILVQAGADRNAVDRFGRTPLHEAVLNGKDALILFLAQHGARLHLQNPASVLCDAANQGDLPLLRRYCDAGADPNAADYDSRTCLMLAAANGNLPLCQLLIDRGAAPAATDRWGHTAHDEALRYGHTGSLADLLRCCPAEGKVSRS